MTAMLLALFLWFLLRRLQPPEAEYTCRGCFGLVHFERRLGRFVHRDGRPDAVDHPIETVDPLDPGSAPMTHLASPIDYTP